MNYNDKAYLYIDAVDIPDTWDTIKPGWFCVDVVLIPDLNQISFGNKRLPHLAKVIILESKRKIYKFYNVPSKTGAKIASEHFKIIQKKSIFIEDAKLGSLKVTDRKTRLRKIGFSSSEEYSEYWSQLTPYLKASRIYLDLYYLFRDTGTLPMPGQSLQKSEPSVTGCSTC